MLFCHCFQQKGDHLWMKIFANQYPGRASDQWHVIGWNYFVQINHTLWQYQSNKIGINTAESLGHWKGHKFNAGISQHGLNTRRIRSADKPNNIDLVFIQCRNRFFASEWQERCRFRCDPTSAKDGFGRKSSGAALRPYGNAFSFELRKMVNRFGRGVKDPIRLIVDES